MKSDDVIYRDLVTPVNYENELAYYINLLEDKGFSTEYICIWDWEGSELQVSIKKVGDLWYASEAYLCNQELPYYSPPKEGSDLCDKSRFRSIISKLNS